MNRSPESLKPLANRLAEVLSTREGRRALRLLRLAGFAGETAVRGEAGATVRGDGAARQIAAPPAAATDRVGIWERKPDGGDPSFVRRMDRIAEWHHWANLGRIPPRSARRRVILLGESAARGYLYDPQFTPARALERMLASHLGPEGIEVIDLARTDLGLEIGELAASALLLEPDAVVIFAGNNWKPSFALDSAALPAFDARLRREGVPGLKQLAEEQLAASAGRLVEQISSLYAARRVPVVWIVPEFNLADWRDPATDVPRLPGGAQGEWVERFRAAEAALRAGDLARLEAEAEALAELDRGTGVAGLYWLAEAALRRGDGEAARCRLGQARDAALWDPQRSASPRPYTVAQETLRRDAVRGGGALIDVPRLFAEHLAGDIPGRRLFLDYCHMTSEGILVTMAATAAALLCSLAGIAVPWQGLAGEGGGPSAEVEADAAFLAAVHNAHWWQPYVIVHHHCLRSVRAAPAIAEVMTRFIDLQVGRAPAAMSRAAEEIVELGSPAIQHYLLGASQQLDRVLLDAMTAALEEAGIESADRLVRLRRAAHSVERRETDLLDYYYGSAGLQPEEVRWATPGAAASGHREGHFYRAYWQESRFVFVGEAGRPVRLSLTCRLPEGEAAEGRVTIQLNGEPLVELDAGPRWRTWEVAVPGAAVCDDINGLTVEWPIPSAAGEDLIEAALDDLIDGVLPELRAVFGEIHAFTVSGVRVAGEVNLEADEHTKPRWAEKQRFRESAL